MIYLSIGQCKTAVYPVCKQWSSWCDCPFVVLRSTGRTVSGSRAYLKGAHFCRYVRLTDTGRSKAYFMFQNQNAVLHTHGHISMQSVKHKTCNPTYFTGVIVCATGATGHQSGYWSLYCIASLILSATGTGSRDGVEKLFANRHSGTLCKYILFF